MNVDRDQQRLLTLSDKIQWWERIRVYPINCYDESTSPLYCIVPIASGISGAMCLFAAGLLTNSGGTVQCINCCAISGGLSMGVCCVSITYQTICNECVQYKNKRLATLTEEINNIKRIHMIS